MSRRLLGGAVLLFLSSCASRPDRVAPAIVLDTTPPADIAVTDSMLRAGHSGDPTEWPTYGGDITQRRFSPLKEITADNVARLKPKWIWQSGYAESFQSTPLVVGGAMYVSTPMVEQTQRVVKLNAATGRVIWDTRIRIGTALFCCGPNNRGVAAWGDKVFLATLDARLIALRTSNGEIAWEAALGDPSQGYGNTSAPSAFGGKVFIGTSGGEWSIRGFFKAFDAETGQPLWTWNTIPSPEEGGWWGEWIEKAPGTDLSLNRDIAKEKADSARYADSWQRGGGPIWMPSTIDAERGLLYVSVGNVNPDYNGVTRPGDNRWGSSICALRIADGTRAWCWQWIPHDVWDFDGASPPFLFDLEREGKKVPALGVFTKVGFLYVLDREKGTLLTRSDAYVPQSNLFKVPTAHDSILVAPGSAGGTNWSPGAYSPLTRFTYTAAIDWPMITLADAGETCPAGHICIGGDLAIAPGQSSAAGAGILAAVDPNTGKVAWQQKTTLPLIGGVLATAGGLVFSGQSDGSFDAWDATTGNHLWQYRTGAGCNAAPMTWQIEGKQQIGIACGGSFILARSGMPSPPGGTLFVFELP
ncbi:MAG TPA: PQQ-binding-like beta-propeller repeat protein [Gemmatimonadales bacterium]|nr:PQQ-binding-like beta-propeller repeat protein [Gemmatimonadales bacterium]